MKLTLLPMLASAAAAAQPAPAPPFGPPSEEVGGPPGMTEPMLAPPGLTPVAPQEIPANCAIAPDGTLVCVEPQHLSYSFRWGGSGHHVHHRVYRGGFGHYFFSAGS